MASKKQIIQTAPQNGGGGDDIATMTDHRNWLILCIIVTIALHAIDATIINVALPHMQGSLQANFDQISWVITTYLLAIVIATPLVSWFAHRFGAKNLLVASILLFTFASVMCGLALSLDSMIAARFFQGAAGAPLIPLSQTILVRLSTNEDRAKLMGIMGVGVMMGPVLGPTIGGYITEYASWRWVFFINVPLGLLSAFGLSVLLKRRLRMADRPFNLMGYAMLAISIACLQLSLDRGETLDWFDSAEMYAYLTVGCAAFWMFIVNSTTSNHPFIPPELFKDRNFMVGTFLYFLVAANMTTALVLQPTLMQKVMGYPILDTGILLIPRGLGMMLGMAIAPKILQLVSATLLLFISITIMMIGIYPFAYLNVEAPASSLTAPPFFHGIGLGLTFVIASTMSYSTLRQDIQVDGATFFNLMRGLGQALGVSLIVSVVSRYSQINQTELMERITTLTLPDEAFWQSSQAMAVATLEIQRQAAMIAYSNAYIALIVMALSIFAALAFMKDFQKSAPSSQ